jgi:succinyl-CoA synthetase alpha subunit
VPIFNTVAEAAEQTGATATDDLRAAAVRGRRHPRGASTPSLDLVVAITEGIPVRDMVRVKRAMAGRRTRLIGPNCPGLVTPVAATKSSRRLPHRHRSGLHPQARQRRRRSARSGTLTYEAVWQLTSRGIGQSTCVGIGGDPVNGTSHLDVIKTVQRRPGDRRHHHDRRDRRLPPKSRPPRWIKASTCKKPVAGFIAGATAPPGRRMGHAGAVIGGAEDTAAAKIKIFQECGISVAATPSDMADALLRIWKG